MASRKEIVIDHERLRDPNTITPITQKAFKDAGFDIHRDEATTEDDHGKGKRVYKIRNVRYFDLGRKSGR